MARLAFAWRMIWERWLPERALCPYCGSRFYHFLQRKRLLIQARKCAYCGLIYRWPTDAPGGTRAFYEKAYDGQQATNVPDPKRVQELVSIDFRGTQYDKSERTNFLRRTVDGKGRLLDFGCSWGYSAYQYALAGFQVTGFELDRNRARFGREQLGLDLRSSWDDFGTERFDIILSDHSLEHVPNPDVPIERWSSVTKDGAKLVIFVPNGGGREARRKGVKWGPFVGEAHTVAFTINWFAQNLPRHRWSPSFYTSKGEPLWQPDYLADQNEIALVAVKL